MSNTAISQINFPPLIFILCLIFLCLTAIVIVKWISKKDGIEDGNKRND